MISFQNFSFRYEESKDFTLRGIDMTVADRRICPPDRAKWLWQDHADPLPQRSDPHFYPGEIQGDLVMDGRSLLEMKPITVGRTGGNSVSRPALPVLHDGHYAGTGLWL